MAGDLMDMGELDAELDSFYGEGPVVAAAEQDVSTSGGPVEGDTEHVSVQSTEKISATEETAIAENTTSDITENASSYANEEDSSNFTQQVEHVNGGAYVSPASTQDQPHYITNETNLTQQSLVAETAAITSGTAYVPIAPLEGQGTNDAADEHLHVVEQAGTVALDNYTIYKSREDHATDESTTFSQTHESTSVDGIPHLEPATQQHKIIQTPRNLDRGAPALEDDSVKEATLRHQSAPPAIQPPSDERTRLLFRNHLRSTSLPPTVIETAEDPDEKQPPDFSTEQSSTHEPQPENFKPQHQPSALRVSTPPNTSTMLEGLPTSDGNSSLKSLKDEMRKEESKKRSPLDFFRMPSLELVDQSSGGPPVLPSQDKLDGFDDIQSPLRSQSRHNERSAATVSANSDLDDVELEQSATKVEVETEREVSPSTQPTRASTEGAASDAVDSIMDDAADEIVVDNKSAAVLGKKGGPKKAAKNTVPQTRKTTRQSQTKKSKQQTTEEIESNSAASVVVVVVDVDEALKPMPVIPSKRKSGGAAQSPAVTTSVKRRKFESRNIVKRSPSRSLLGRGEIDQTSESSSLVAGSTSAENGVASAQLSETTKSERGVNNAEKTVVGISKSMIAGEANALDVSAHHRANSPAVPNKARMPNALSSLHDAWNNVQSQSTQSRTTRRQAKSQQSGVDSETDAVQVKHEDEGDDAQSGLNGSTMVHASTPSKHSGLAKSKARTLASEPAPGFQSISMDGLDSLNRGASELNAVGEGGGAKQRRTRKKPAQDEQAKEQKVEQPAKGDKGKQAASNTKGGKRLKDGAKLDEHAVPKQHISGGHLLAKDELLHLGDTWNPTPHEPPSQKTETAGQTTTRLQKKTEVANEPNAGKAVMARRAGKEAS